MKNIKHKATTQSTKNCLYFALSPLLELITILIPIYSSAESNPTIAIFLNATYHFATVFLNCSTIDLLLPPSSCLWSAFVLKKLATKAETFPANIYL